MNYLPFVGFWFYGGANSTERANFYSSWGLMDDLPDVAPVTVTQRVRNWLWEFFN